MNNRLKIKLTGKNTTYFFNELIKRNIPIYDINKSLNKLEVIIDKKDYKEISSIKTSLKLEITNRYGLSKIKYILRKYKLLFIFLILSILLNILLSNIVFKIEIINSNKSLVEEISKDLDKLGLKKYTFRPSTSRLMKIKESLLKDESIEWLEIERHGTKYIIKVEMRKFNTTEEECKPRNIVSKKNATITKIEATSGEIIKSKGDYVVEGETIVSGLIYNKETIMNKVCATGKVYGKTWYKVNVTIPRYKKVTKLTNKFTHGIYIKILNKEYNIHNKFSNAKEYEYNIIKSKLVPLDISITKYLKEKKYMKKISSKQSKKIALTLATSKIKKHLSKDEKIIDKKILKNTINNSKIDVEVFIVAEENITDYFDISDINIDELNKKEE